MESGETVSYKINGYFYKVSPRIANRINKNCKGGGKALSKPLESSQYNLMPWGWDWTRNLGDHAGRSPIHHSWSSWQDQRSYIIWPGRRAYHYHQTKAAREERLYLTDCNKANYPHPPIINLTFHWSSVSMQIR